MREGEGAALQVPAATGAPSSQLSQRLADLRYVPGFAAVYLIALLGSEHLYGTLEVASPFWFPESVLLCALFLAPRKHWWVFILAIWPIRLLAGDVVPDTPTLIIV